MTKYYGHVKFEAVISSRVNSEDLNNCIFSDLETEKYYSILNCREIQKIREVKKWYF